MTNSHHLHTNNVRHNIALAAWCALCGVIASGQFRLTADVLMTLAPLWLIVAGAWQVVWHVLAERDWMTWLARWRNWHSEGDVKLAYLPYQQPNSPAAKTMRALSQANDWMRRDVLPSQKYWLLATLAAVIVALIMSATIDPLIVLATTLMLCAAQIGLFVNGIVAKQIAHASVMVTLATLAGFAAFNQQISVAMLIGAAAFAAMYLGLQLGVWRIWNLALGVIVIGMLWLGQTVGAFVIALLWVALWASFVRREFARQLIWLGACVLCAAIAMT